MDSRGKKSALLFVTFVVAVFVAAYVVVTLISNSHHDQDVKDANAAAKVYTTKVAAYDGQVKTSIGSLDADDPAAALKTVDTLMSGGAGPVPRLKKIDGYGAKHSAAYASAKKLKPAADLTSLKSALTEAASAQAWTKAADAALTDPLPLFPKGQFRTGEPLRKEFIPTLKKLLSTYERVKIPAAGGPADKEVKATLNFMISSASTLADRIDAQQNYNIDYPSHYKAGRDAVAAVKKTTKTQAATAIKAAQG